MMPYLRAWLTSAAAPIQEIHEPFCGGGIASLTAVAEGLAEKAILTEVDPDIAAVWSIVLNRDAERLAARIVSFELSQDSVAEWLHRECPDEFDRAFRAILLNRVNRSGILAPGAGRIKSGENGRGLASRWYPTTLASRIMAINAMRERIKFIHGDGMASIASAPNSSSIALFVDPPYTVAGRRLYRFNCVDHAKLFELCRVGEWRLLMTYDQSPEIERLAARNGLAVERAPMKSSHHEVKFELMISREFEWLASIA